MGQQYSVISLFSGCSGLDLGLINANSRSKTITAYPIAQKFKILWANDKYEPSCNTYAKNFKVKITKNHKEKIDGGRIFCGDIRKVSFQHVLNSNPIDVIAGGFPCQDFSIITGPKGKGTEVKRGRLYLHFVRSLAELQPKMFIAENVKNLCQGRNKPAYEKIKEDFQNLGNYWDEIKREYDENIVIEPVTHSIKGYKLLFSEIINSACLGAPQKRERLIMIGLREDIASKRYKNDLLLKKINSIKEKLHGEKEIFPDAPITTMEIFEGKTLDGLENKKYSNIIKSYEKEFSQVNSKRKKIYTQKIWPNYNFSIWDDYIWINNCKSKGNKWRRKVIKEHASLLKELGFINSEIKNKVFTDDTNKELKSSNEVKDRMKHIPPNENHEFVNSTKWHVNGKGLSLIYRRIHPLKYSYTIVARGGGGTWGYHYEKNRQKLTNRERARIQTFPDDFVFKGTSSEIRRQIGEAVPPLVGKRIGECLLELLEEIQ